MISPSSIRLVASLMRRYLQIYWLKPFDAVNDTANAWTLRQFNWRSPILEVGSGDGEFSFIMHGGEFIFLDDRYDQSNPDLQGDIFDVYRRDLPLTIKRDVRQRYLAGVDLKLTHVRKCKETHLYDLIVASPPHLLPFADGSFETVFLYFPHGLEESGDSMRYDKVLLEIRRVLCPGGTLLMTAMNSKVSKFFVCHNLYRYLALKGWPRLASYFKKLDAGRHEEISGFGQSLTSWVRTLEDAKFSIDEAWAHLKPIAWCIYDLQTRPILGSLIRFNWFLKGTGLKRIVKFSFVFLFLPFAFIFFQLFARPRRLFSLSGESNSLCYVFRLHRD